MATDAVVTALRQAWNVLGELHVPAALMGGLALAHWGRIRSTQDVDLLIALSGLRPHAVLARLAAAGYRSKRRDPIIRLDDVEFIQLFYDPPEMALEVQIDFLLADSSFHRQAIERRVTLPESELGFPIDVVSCEDLIVLKLLAGRILDRIDAGELMKANREGLDLAYLTGWVRRLHLEKPFVEAWGDVFPYESPPV